MAWHILTTQNDWRNLICRHSYIEELVAIWSTYSNTFIRMIEKHCRTTSVAMTDQVEYMTINLLQSNLKTTRGDYKLTPSTIGLSGHGTTFQEQWSTQATLTLSSADLTKRGITSHQNTTHQARAIRRGTLVPMNLVFSWLFIFIITFYHYILLLHPYIIHLYSHLSVLKISVPG